MEQPYDDNQLGSVMRYSIVYLTEGGAMLLCQGVEFQVIVYSVYVTIYGLNRELYASSCP